MSDKKNLNDEIQQELEDRLDDSEEIFETEEDFTVKVHREDYTVKRRFYDKGKALETADSLRQDKRNVVEDNFEQDFETPVAEEDEVDWDKLVDGGLNFFPPISDAADKKLEETSKVAEELAAESARVSSDLDKTMTMSPGKVPNYPKIEPKNKSAVKEETSVSELDDNELETDDIGEIEVDDLGEIDLDVSDQEEAFENVDDTDDEMGIVDEKVVDRSPGKKEKNKYGQKNSPMKIIMLLLVVVVAGSLYYYFTLPPQTPGKEPVVSKNEVNQPIPVVGEKVAVETKQVELPEPEKEEPNRVTEENITEPVPVEPSQPEKVVTIPAVTKNYPYTIHISSYRSKNKADAEVSRIRKKGYDTFSVVIEIPGKGEWRRIYTGYYETYKEATAAVAELKKKMPEDLVVAKTFFGVQIGPVAEKNDLAEMETRLRSKGYTPYYLPVSDDGKYVRLLTGAYKKEKDISGLLNKLIEDGFDAEVVKR